MKDVKSHYYSQHAVGLRADLGRAITREQMRVFHAKVARPAFRRRDPAVRDPGPVHLGPDPIRQPADLDAAGARAGLHDLQLHGAAARSAAPQRVRAPACRRRARSLALAYAIPSGISASQFTRWHLDHHAELGSSEDDPKRHYLSPKINARWYKLLYATPALFPIYFRAARKETVELSGGAAADDRLGAPGRDLLSPRRARADLVGVRVGRGAARERDPGVLRVSRSPSR